MSLLRVCDNGIKPSYAELKASPSLFNQPCYRVDTNQKWMKTNVCPNDDYAHHTTNTNTALTYSPYTHYAFYPSYECKPQTRQIIYPRGNYQKCFYNRRFN